MIPPCAVINDQILPMVRASVAGILADDGWSQSQIASGLGISQAMVSKYLRNPSSYVPLKETEPLVLEIAGLVKIHAEPAILTKLFCQWCFHLKEKGNLCSHHPVENCSVCMSLRSREEVGERFDVLHDIQHAIEKLEGIDLSLVLPEVRINIAQSLSDAETTMDVASVPGRLVPLRNSITAFAPPEFGVSHHLASLLLRAMRNHPEIRSVMNIRYDPGIQVALEKSMLDFVKLDRTIFPDIGGLFDSRQWHGQSAVIDPGDFGIEPCTYLFGQSSSLVVENALILLNIIHENQKVTSLSGG